jgi:exodeoxyribonuclease V alpha subunit
MAMNSGSPASTRGVGEPRGRLRQDANAVRFVEVVVNGPKSWSLAAALHPEIAEAYDAAMDRAATQIIGWLAQHATTRVGPRGRQVQVPVERIEAVTVRHYTSRAGDPHRHLHLQVNARVFAEGKWRGLHTIGVRDSIDAINGIGHAAMMTDPEFREALAAHGFSLDVEAGEVSELASFVGPFSARARQIGRNIDRYEAEWREARPGEEPGPRLRRAWDSRAWAEARPDKVVPKNGAELVERWNDELRVMGYRGRIPQLALPMVTGGPLPGALDRQRAVEVVVSRLGARRSAWNQADVRGEVERWIATTGLVASAAVRIELAEDLTSRAIDTCSPLLQAVPEHIRALTSPEVLAVEADIVARLVHRAEQPASAADIDGDQVGALDVAQREAVAALAGTGALLVVEGAAGAGKTTTLAAAKTLLEGRGHRLVVVTPTLKAAQVAGREVGAGAFSAAWLVHQHGWRWDEHGHWTRTHAGPDPDAVLRPGDLLLVDEAGMLDQDTARALLTLADEAGARVALVGDRHQLPAVGRGGVLDIAARWAPPDACVSLDVVYRFSDPDYAAVSLAMRTGISLTAARHACGERRGKRVGLNAGGCYQDVADGKAGGEDRGERVGEVFDALLACDQIRIYPCEAERTHALAELAVASILSGEQAMLVMADTHDQVAALNGVIRDRLVAAGRVDDVRATITVAGERLGVGDRVATRRNDRALGVANRDTWTITAAAADGTLTVQGNGRAGVRALPAGYVREQVELAYATTVYGAQGETTPTGHLLLGEHTTGSAAYVGLTRGRNLNVAHLVAANVDGARAMWDATFNRDRADLGPAHAARRAAEDVERYAPHRPLVTALAELRAAWKTEQDFRDAIRSTTRRRDAVAVYGNATAGRVTEIDADLAELTDELHAASKQVRIRLHEPAIRTLAPGRIEQERAHWLHQRRQSRLAAQQRWKARQTAHSYEPYPGYMRIPDRGRGIGR